MSNGMLVNAQDRFDIFRLHRENQKLKQLLKTMNVKLITVENNLVKLTKDFLDLKENLEVEEILEEVTEDVTLNISTNVATQ